MRDLRPAAVAAHHPVSQLPLKILQVPFDGRRPENLWTSRFPHLRSKLHCCKTSRCFTAWTPKQIPVHVESVVYDHRDQSIRVKTIPPRDAEGENDSTELQVPTETGRR